MTVLEIKNDYFNATNKATTLIRIIDFYIITFMLFATIDPATSHFILISAIASLAFDLLQYIVKGVLYAINFHYLNNQNLPRNFEIEPWGFIYIIAWIFFWLKTIAMIVSSYFFIKTILL